MPKVFSAPLIAVRNIRFSSRWFADLLGGEALPEHPHRDVYDRISTDGSLLLQLHAWDVEDHPNLTDAGAAPVGHGVVLWFTVEDFDARVARASALGAEVLQGPHVNPASQNREIWFRHPDGFVIVIASPDGEAGGAEPAKNKGNAEAWDATQQSGGSKSDGEAHLRFDAVARRLRRPPEDRPAGLPPVPPFS